MILGCNQTFAVNEELPGVDGRIYLRLADGRGWAFDDAALHPNDPSVTRGHWSSAESTAMAVHHTSVETVLPPPQAASISWYRVAYLGGIVLRTGPSFSAPRNNVILHCNQTFAVSQEIFGTDLRRYLRVADGRGWAFDDTALYPNDPSVIRGKWSSTESAATEPSGRLLWTLPPMGTCKSVPPPPAWEPKIP